MTKKQLSDAAAYIRAFAQMRGRNAEWAERAVRDGVSLSAEEALAQKVIDLTAADVPELLSKLDGRKVTTAGGERTLATAGATLVTAEPDWRTRFLAIITDPSVALILLMIGVYGLFFEFWNPGLALPGVVGAVCLLIGLFALQMLPVNYAGLAHLVREAEGGRRLTRMRRWALAPLHRRFQMDRLVRFNEKFSPEWRPRYLLYESRAALPRAIFRVLVVEGYLPQRPAASRWWSRGVGAPRRAGRPTPATPGR